MSKTDLTNQRQVFVEDYVKSGDHLEDIGLNLDVVLESLLLERGKTIR